MKVVLTALNAKFIHSSLALKYLAASCRSICPALTVKDYTINNELLHILSDLYAEQPDVVGFACYIWNVDMTLELAGLVKKVLPQAVIILGGPEVSYDPADIMARHKQVDYIIQGEGEETLAALLTALKLQLPVSEIAGLSWRGSDDIRIGTPQVVTRLDSIPFPYRDEDMAALNNKIIYYESTRGCPFSCSYCLSSATRGVRFFSLERIYQDLAFFIRQRVKQVKFVDRTFNAKKEHYLPMLKFLAAQECSTNFHFEIAADLLDDEVLEFLATVPPGRFQFEIGVQSTHEPTLAAISRSNNWDKITRAVRRILATGNIHLHLDLIVGLPYEDYATFGRSFNDVYRLRPDMLQIGFLKMLKGAGVRQEAQEHEYVYLDKAPYEVLANRWLTYGEVRRLKILEEVFNQLYNSGRLAHTLTVVAAEYYGQDAFKLYNDLADYWESRQLHLTAHNARSLYKYVWEFCMEHGFAKSIIQEFMKFDAVLQEKGGLKPEFLPWPADSKGSEHAWRSPQDVQKYLPGYAFTTWRELNRSYGITVFAIDIPLYFRTGELVHRPAALLFAYQEESAVWRAIENYDFAVKGDCP